jgi:hypothetical protein
MFRHVVGGGAEHKCALEAGELFLERFFALYRKLMQADSNASSAPASPAAVTYVSVRALSLNVLRM